ncbi:hypothetical protein ACH5RR_021933 [Cinchona calisaya]|uniref:HECT domain-containing protein n=1 Tax=Cinchona calisaya TaxID=153742 RepID=A0ABD2Z6E0_9GENT
MLRVKIADVAAAFTGSYVQGKGLCCILELIFTQVSEVKKLKMVLGDDSILLCLPEKVYDVKLGDTVEDTPGAPISGYIEQAVPAAEPFQWEDLILLISGVGFKGCNVIGCCCHGWTCSWHWERHERKQISAWSQFSKVVEYFWLLGRVMVKALQDGRLMDLPQSTAIYKLVLGQELELQDIHYFDATLGKTLQDYLALVCRNQYLQSTKGHIQDKVDDLRFQGLQLRIFV